MSSTLNLQPFSPTNPQSFDPNVHFALPVLTGAKLTLTGDKKEVLRALLPESAEARLNKKAADVLGQSYGRVDATIRAVKDVHTKLQNNDVRSAIARMEIETALLTFVTRMKEKIENNLHNPFTSMGSRMYGGLSQLTTIQSELTAELVITTTMAQGEQLHHLGIYGDLMTAEEAARRLKEALLHQKSIEKGFMFRMDPNTPSPSTIYLVEAVKREMNFVAAEGVSQPVVDYNIRESVITLRDGKYTLELSDSDPQHAFFRGVSDAGEKRNEWQDFFALMAAFRGKYGIPISNEPLPPHEQIDSQDALLELAVEEPPAEILHANSFEAPHAAVELSLQPIATSSSSSNSESLLSNSKPTTPSLVRTKSTPVVTPSPMPLDQLAEIVKMDTLQKAVDKGLWHEKVGPLAVSKELTKHRTALKIVEKGAVNFMLRKDISGELYINLQLCTSVGQFSEDFDFIQREFEITKIGIDRYTIGQVPGGKPWPYRTNEWDSFTSMIQYFAINCGVPVYAKL